MYKLLTKYASFFSILGLYSGFNSIGLPKTKKLSEKCVNALFISFLFICPITHPFVIKKMFLRIKKRYKIIPITNQDYYPII